MSEFKSNGGRKPIHIVRSADRLKTGAAPVAAGRAAPGTPQGGPAGYMGRPRAAVTLAEIPSLARALALTLEDGPYLHAVRCAAGELFGDGGAAPPPRRDRALTIEEEGALERAFTGKAGSGLIEVRGPVPHRDRTEVPGRDAEELGALVRAFGLPARGRA